MESSGRVSRVVPIAALLIGVAITACRGVVAAEGAPESPLRFDRDTHTIPGDAEANALLKRLGRKEFKIPEQL